MSEHAVHAGAHESHYKKIWAILLGLLVVSFAGPFLGIKIVTLLTAFGIAVVKAYLVCKNFMHLDVQPRFVVYTLLTVLVFMLLFYAGAAPDVEKRAGHHWTKSYVEPAQTPAAHH
jgi:caa(3)-type oxidase subunit IV